MHSNNLNEGGRAPGFAPRDFSMKLPPLGYDPTALPRELQRHYISASESDLKAMLAAIGKRDFKDLYSHVPEHSRMTGEVPIPQELGYEELQKALFDISRRNRRALSFLGDGLPNFAVQSIPISPSAAKARSQPTGFTKARSRR